MPININNSNITDYDIAIIGGGIQGVGVAQAAAVAGYTVAVFEQTGIASATSSKSSKLIHGGLRYLESGQFKLVRKSLLERERLIKLAPGLVKPVPFYIPIYKQTSRKSWEIGVGLFLYRILGSFKRYTRFKYIAINKNKTSPIKGLLNTDLKTVFQYYDAQTDDRLLTHAVMHSAQSLGATLHCPAKVIQLDFKEDGYHIQTESTQRMPDTVPDTIRAKFIVNVAGPWANDVLAKVTGTPVETVEYDLVQGTHIVIDAPAPEGVIYVEAPQDKRAVFIMPWKNKTLIGTTEKAYQGDPAKVVATEDEIQYLKEIYAHYMPGQQVNVVDTFAGVRVLPKQETSFFARPRDTLIHASAKNLLTLYGGKLTSYRATAEQVMEEIENSLPEELKRHKSVKDKSTKQIHLV